MPLVNGRWPPSIYLCLCNKRRGDGGRAQWRSRIDFLQLGMSWVASPPSKKTNSRPHNEISEWLVLDFRRIAFAFLFFFFLRTISRSDLAGIEIWNATVHRNIYLKKRVGDDKQHAQTHKGRQHTNSRGRQEPRLSAATPFPSKGFLFFFPFFPFFMKFFLYLPPRAHFFRESFFFFPSFCREWNALLSLHSQWATVVRATMAKKWKNRLSVDSIHRGWRRKEKKCARPSC